MLHSPPETSLPPNNHRRNKRSDKNVKRRQKRGQNNKKNEMCKRMIKNVADICRESNYYLCTLSRM